MPRTRLRWIELPDPDPTVTDAIPARAYPFADIFDFDVIEEAA